MLSLTEWAAVARVHVKAYRDDAVVRLPKEAADFLPVSEHCCSVVTKHVHFGCMWACSLLYSAIAIGNMRLVSAICCRTPERMTHVALELAAGRGNLECVRLLIELGCPLDDPRIIENAAVGGHLECLRYLHEAGCSWDEWAVFNAVELDRVACVQYLIEAGCPYSRLVHTAALLSGSTGCLAYLERYLVNDG
jgi:ankyrin repeat protein